MLITGMARSFSHLLFWISILVTSVPATAAAAAASPRPRDPYGRYFVGSLSQREDDVTLVLPSGWGLDSACVNDSPAPNRLLPWFDNTTGMTISSCLNKCAFHGFVYAGLEAGEDCWCGNSLNTAGGAGTALPSLSCQYRCSGDNTSTSTTTCGGGFALTVYKRTTLAPSPYTHATVYAGKSFFDGWSFFTTQDPTGGSVAFQSKSAAMSQGLVQVREDDGVVLIKVDNSTRLQPGENRASVRITTTATYTSALMIFDVLAMPWGCSVWPAIWTVGPDWPTNGEIDIIEGVNTMDHNQITFHTGSTTTCNTSNIPGNWISSDGFGGRVCTSSPANNGGCGFEESKDPGAGTYGQNFNNVGGGVYVLMLSDEGVKVWRWKRSEIPSDITEGNAPQPDGWGLPAAILPSDSSCPTQSLIKDQSIVIDTTLCGGWCRDTYVSMGCGSNCTERIPDPRNYDNAYWLIKSIAVWQ